MTGFMVQGHKYLFSMVVKKLCLFTFQQPFNITATVCVLMKEINYNNLIHIN